MRYGRRQPLWRELLPTGGAVLFTLLLWAGGTPSAQAGRNRFYLASQMDFERKRGFFLDLENESAGSQPCRLSSLRLILGVADGKNWRYLAVTPPWEVGKAYTVRATIAPEGAALSRDGERLAQAAETTLTPAEGRLTAGERPGWAGDPAEYLVQQTSLRLIVNGRTSEIILPAPRALPLYLFEPQSPIVLPDLRVPSGAALTIEATFRLESSPADLRPLAPFVDPFGQSRHAQWPEKVKSDADLTRAAEDETQRNAAWEKPKGYDAYGGYVQAPWHEQATGFYRVMRRGGQWWLLSPEGNPTFYIGLCTAPALAWEKTPVTGREFLFTNLPPREGENGAFLWSQGAWGGDGEIAYAALHAMNLLRKYGPDVWQERAKQSLERRLEVWGFSGQGKWCEQVGRTPIVTVLNRNDVPKLVRHPDVFDLKVRATFATAIRRQIEPHKNDPTLLGWSLGNEFDEIITRTEVEEILQKHSESPAAKALKAYAPQGDLETMRRHFADAYYGFIYRTVKESDPNHLYCGFWITPGWWENAQDWRLIAAHCDIIGYDRYADTFTDESFSRLLQETDRPVLCGEFSFPAWYDGARGYGLYGSVWARTDAEAGRKYACWIADAATNPYCVGVLWFQYRDQPITGRGPGQATGAPLTSGEHYAFGLVDITDRPKWDLVTQVRTANLRAVALRLKTTGTATNRTTAVFCAGVLPLRLRNSWWPSATGKRRLPRQSLLSEAADPRRGCWLLGLAEGLWYPFPDRGPGFDTHSHSTIPAE